MPTLPSSRPRVPRCRPTIEFLEARLAPAAGLFTYHGDNLNTGRDTSEPLLTPASVTPASFGKRFAAVDGQLYAQPLAVPDVRITAGTSSGVHDVGPAGLRVRTPPGDPGGQGGAVGSGQSGGVAPALKIALDRGPFHALPRPGWLRQRVTLRNEGAGAIQGPLTLVLDQLPPGVRLRLWRGFSVTRTPHGKEYRLASVARLRPGQSVSVVLVFIAPGRGSVPYRLRVE
jgi:hypothetical protein